MPRRAPRSRYRSAKLSARRLLTPQGRAWSIRPLQHPVRLLLLMDLASPRFPREPGVELLSDLVEGGELCLAEHVVRRAAQCVLVAQDRVAQLGRRRVQDAAGAGGRGLRAVAPEDAGQDVLGGRGVRLSTPAMLSGSTAASAR